MRSNFLIWVDRMDYYRLIVLVGTILFHTCVTVPFAMWSMDAVYGFHTMQMLLITIAGFAVIVTNLSVQPMRVTIPVFIISTAMLWLLILINTIIYLMS